MRIRDVELTDSKILSEIYNHYIESTFISFEEEVISEIEMAKRINVTRSNGLPWLVVEVDGAVVGYAYAGVWKARSAYRYTVESSVYISHEYLKNGLGSTLYGSLLERLKHEQYGNVIGSIALPNDPSIRLHERLGFTKVGEFADIGLKFGEKRSVGYWQLKLNE
ncbi:GNAT family N-acetyltransferase [Vibrio sp. WXL103]|uniref:GNAT family N-acetyltransferase n=1 Tax=Vibrio sp. WXL103 TaxID=3450710 RepID=UPI003EC7B057